MFCCFCGLRNSEDAKYCRGCGRPIDQIGSVSQDDTGGERLLFRPREVNIRPNFYTILDDLEIVKDTKQAWEKLGASIESMPKSPFYKRFWGGGWDQYNAV